MDERAANVAPVVAHFGGRVGLIETVADYTRLGAVVRSYTFTNQLGSSDLCFGQCCTELYVFFYFFSIFFLGGGVAEEPCSIRGSRAGSSLCLNHVSTTTITGKNRNHHSAILSPSALTIE